MLGSWWLVMTALTPLYHPYARLWLPLHALGWTLMAGVIAEADSLRRLPPEGQEAGRGEASRRRQRLAFVGLAAACGGSAAIHFMLMPPSAMPWSAVLNPSQATLRTFALKTVPETIPGNGTPIRVFARRPLAFYLAQLGRYTIHLEPSAARILQNVMPDSWSILDQALMNSTAETWNVIRRRPRLSASVEIDPVTMLDIDPGAAFRLPVYWPRNTELYVIAPDQPAAKSQSGPHLPAAEARHDP